MDAIPYEEDDAVMVRFPLTEAQERGPRAEWPWVPGTVLSRIDPDEWRVVVDGVEALATVDPDTGERLYPACYRSAEEIRPAPAGVTVLDHHRQDTGRAR